MKDLPKKERARLLEALDQIEQNSFNSVRVQFRHYHESKKNSLKGCNQKRTQRF